MDFRRRGPSPDALRWVEQALGRGSRVVGSRRMTGGVTSAVHRLTVERGDGSRTFVVLRQYQHPAPGAEAGGRRTDPWWDLLALAAYDDSWRRFIPIQAGGRVPVDAGGMTARVEDLIESVLGRL